MNPNEIIAMLRYNAEWPDIGGMTLNVFHTHKRDILAGLNALTARPKSRKEFRMLAVYSRETNERLAEVFSTTHGPVVVFRSGTVRDPDAQGGGFVRQERGDADLFVQPLDNDPDQRFPLVASGGRYVFTNADLRRWIVDHKYDGRRHAVSLEPSAAQR